ncbi:MAG TPA: ABC transporter substrate-binding protein [Hyphomicrobiales bacterium]|nr:ABC transporter substrate-binding protein [Hyphomicrobiales bacterium]
MRRFGKLAAAVVLAAASLTGGAAMAGTVKVGVITTTSGPFAEFGRQFQGGIEAYQKLHGTTAGGQTVEVIYKDVGGASPSNAKRLAQELVVRDKVQILAGFLFTPNALAAAAVATEAKVPMVVMNAASEGLTSKSPYMVRTSFSLPTTVPPMAKWAAEHGVKSVYVIVADYAPGHDVEKAALAAFPAAGIKVVGDVKTPLSTFDFAPYMQRVADAKPDAIFAFVNGGSVMVAFMKAYREKGLDKTVKLLGTGDITSEEEMDVVGPTAVGAVTTYPASMDHQSKENEAFVAAFKAVRDAKARPNLMAVAAYDGMDLIYKALAKTGGKTDATALVDAMKGMKIDSPRGPISIDPKTRDVVQTMYIRRVEKDPKSGLYVNREFGSYPPQ